MPNKFGFGDKLWLYSDEARKAETIEVRQAVKLKVNMIISHTMDLFAFSLVQIRRTDMNKRKRIAITSLTLASLAALSLAPVASAHPGPNGEGSKPGNRMEQRMKKRAHKIEQRLDNLVKEGKITEEQKQAIVEKLKQNKQKREDIRKIENPEERREAVKKLHEEFKQWLKDQGIDPELLKPPHKPNQI